MNTLDFRPPPLLSVESEPFDASPAAVKQWIAQLPMGNMAEAARLLHVTLYRTNRQQIGAEQRFSMLEALAVPLHAILDEVIRRLASQPLPLEYQPRRLGDFARKLLTEVVIAYQIVLDGQQQGSWLFRLTHHALWPLCTHRLLHYLGQINRVQRLLHSPPATGVWLACHRLYLAACEHGQQHTAVALAWDTSRREEIEQCYIQQLLCALLDPGRFTPAQFLALQQHLPALARLASLHPPGTWHPVLPAYWIRQDIDSPHTVPASQASPLDHRAAPARLLDLGALQGAITERLEHPDRSGPLPTLLDADLLSVLAQAWLVPLGPREPRTRQHRQHDVAVGLSALFSLLRRDGNASQCGISDQQLPEQPKPLLAIPGPAKTIEPELAGTVWDSIFYATELGLNSWSMDSEESPYQYITAIAHDHSDHGSCLEFNTSALHSLGTGELLGYRQQPQGAMQLDEVRWLQQQDETLLTGTMLLAREVEAAVAVKQDGGQRTPLAALLGIGRDGLPLLFLPNLPGISSYCLSLLVDGYEVPVILQQRMAFSPLYVAHGLCAHPKLNSPHALNEAMDLVELNLRLHRITRDGPPRSSHTDPAESFPTPAPVHDDFADLWRVL